MSPPPIADPAPAPDPSGPSPRSPAETDVPFSRFGSTLSFNLVVYFCIGVPLGVVPVFVHDSLGYGVVLAGAAVSLQYLATLAIRLAAGKLVDTRGPKYAVTLGLRFTAASGLFLLLCGFAAQTPWIALALLGISRLAMGVAQSVTSLGSITWALGRAGPDATAKVISWNGMSSYLGIAMGAPFGVLLVSWIGWWAAGASTLLLCLVTLAVVARHDDVPLVAGTPIGFFRVFAKMAPYGVSLALGATGFSVITAFITLYYASAGWPNAALALSVLAVSFVMARVMFGNAIARFGGFQVALACFIVEATGLAMLWLSPWQGLALAGVALTGLGYSQIFPALGVEAVRLVPASNRGAALGSYSLFMDISMFVSGPVAGLIAVRFGYADVFLWSSIAVLAGLALAARLRHLRRAQTALQA